MISTMVPEPLFATVFAADPLEVTKVKLDVSTKTIYLFKSYKLKATITPAKAANKTLIWQSSDESVATVDNKGLVKALDCGETTITATSTNGIVGKCVVTVKVKQVKSIKLNYKRKTMLVGKTYKLKAKYNPSTATYKTVTWTSSNPEVATVNNKGVVTPLKNGKCTITAESVNGKRAKVKVTAKIKKSYFSRRTGTYSENVKAYKAATKIIEEQGWNIKLQDEFTVAQAVATYLWETLNTYEGGGRYWTAYSGLVKKRGSCWAYAHAYLFIAKQLGLKVKTVAVRDKKISKGTFNVYDYETKAKIGWNQIGKDHMAIQYTYKGYKIRIEPQAGEMYIMKGKDFYLLTKAPS